MVASPGSLLTCFVPTPQALNQPHRSSLAVGAAGAAPAPTDRPGQVHRHEPAHVPGEEPPDHLEHAGQGLAS